MNDNTRMKTKKTELGQFIKLSSHPSTILFRSVELNTIYQNTRDIDFVHPTLDLGCGNGGIVKALFDESFTYGVDNGEAKDVDEAIKNKVYGKVFIESAEKMSLSNDSVGFVFSNCVIEHIPNNEAVLSEVSRILKKRGIFIFTVPSHNFTDYLYLTNKFSTFGLGFLSNFYKHKRNQMLNHFHCYSLSDWEHRLSKHGFKIIKYQYYLSRKALMLWDKMALEVFVRKVIDKNAEKKVFDKYLESMQSFYDNDTIEDDQGGGLFIACEKN